jgi:flagellar hook assembly protein FlgD
MGTTDPRADLDLDGDVDADDRQILVDHLDRNCSVSGVRTAAPGLQVELHPNPTSGSTTVAWNQPNPLAARIDIYDLAGRRVREVTVDRTPARAGSALWDGRDEAGRPASAGLYLVRVEAGNEVALKRLVLVR